jgi:hypothetical protein
VKYGLFGSHLLGDALTQTPAIRALRSLRPDAQIGYNHSADRPGGAMREGNPHLDRLEMLAVWPREPRAYPLSRFVSGDVLCPLDALQAYRWGERHGRTLRRRRRACSRRHGDGPPLRLCDDRHGASTRPRSRGKVWWRPSRRRGGPALGVLPQRAGDGSPPNKCAANRHRCEISAWLARQGFQPIAIGGPDAARDFRYAAFEGARAYDLPIRDVAALLAASHAVLSVHTGVRHLAAAVGANLYCVSGAVPLSLIRCVPVRSRQRVHEVAIPVSDVDARILAEGASKVL